MNICTIHEVDISNGQPLTMESNISWKNKGMAVFCDYACSIQTLETPGFVKVNMLIQQQWQGHQGG